jgi:deazaflavin-dependent oxidoreductase (nitroreductase family)
MWFNPLMKWLLASPLHFFVSGNTMLITYKGRKSGKTFTTPINYLRNGDCLITTSLHQRVWWRNLRGGDSVELLIKRKALTAVPRVLEEQAAVEGALGAYFRLAPKVARYYKLTLDEEGDAPTEDLANLAKDMVVIEFQVSG